MIHIFTHDSIGLGEDGPTHQPVEQLASLRAIPGLYVIRPGDANEVAEAWREAHRPHSTSRSCSSSPGRTSRPSTARNTRRPTGCAGAATCSPTPRGEPEVILLATGSEVALASQAHEELDRGRHRRARRQPAVLGALRAPGQAYRDEVLPPAVTARVAVEQASTLGWDRFVGPEGASIGMHTFGASAPLKDVQTKFGFTPDRVARDCQGGTRTMKPTQELHDLGQSLWLDNITRTMLDDGTRERYIDELQVTGLTSNPTIFDKAIGGGDAYDEQITELREKGIEPRGHLLRAGDRRPDARRDLFKPIHERDRRHRRLGLARGLAAARLRHRGDDQQAADLHGAPSGTTLHQDPGHARGPAGDRGVDLRGRADQRDAALRRTQYHGRGRRVHEGHRAAHRGGPRPGRRRRCSRCSSAAGTSP